MTKTDNFHSAMIIFICIVLCFVTPGYSIEFPQSSDHIKYTAHGQKSLDDFTVEYINEELGVSVMNFTGNYDKNINDQFNVQARQAVLKALYENQPDIYDFVYIFTTFEFDTGSASAFATSLENSTQGIGDIIYDNSEQFYSDQLKHLVDMAALSRWNFNPSENSYDPLLDLMMHETMHFWGVSAHYLDNNGNVSNRLLASDSAHWSFFLDSSASVMHGSLWQETAPNQFTATDTRRGLSPLDLYLAGFLPPTSVPDFFVINQGSTGESNDLPPSIGTMITGVKETVSINDIIAYQGPRIPNHENAQHDFRIKFVVLKSPEESLGNSTIADLYVLQNGLQQRFFAETRGVGHLVLPKHDSTHAVSDPDILEYDSQLNTSFDATSAVDFLIEANIDNHWQDAPGSQVRDTVTTIEALQLVVDQFPMAQNAIDQAILWLNNYEPINLEEMAWMLSSRVLNNVKQQSLIEQLINAVNSDGGWGFDVEDQSSPYDTTLVVKALISVESNVSLITAANRQYLNNHINPDNGASYTQNGGSSITVSSMLLPLIEDISNDPQIANEITQYLLDARLPDNGYGSNGMTSPHETATVISALSSRGDATLDNTIDLATAKLNALQSVDGSMQGSVYSTALTIKVLNNNAITN